MFDIESIKLKINQESRTRNYFIPIKLEVFSFSNFSLSFQFDSKNLVPSSFHSV